MTQTLETQVGICCDDDDDNDDDDDDKIDFL